MAEGRRAISTRRPISLQIQINLFMATLMANKLTPGVKAPASGQYRNNSTRTEVTVTRGAPLPPTPKPSQTYTLVDKTKHKK